ncbi:MULTISPECIES: enoyl-CoA hydratase/isomerase family protein [Microbaculum]|uniref:Enoyl-CoA hydratase/isomerase family protein n=1 Tax=Microbaculum marinisediminis TaxID=2931392 RepID=A0AAW5R5E3_9HYPH|nr:enoyl-CoA hydratase/isomerase family protein [Microbaculum sp. A6E488]MCT8974337.1 enoyl-CoA hydratase/isomerase family protein [Microbaculum sp. A6E488]
MTVEREKPRPGVGILRLARADKMNSIDPETDAALRDAWVWAEAQEDVRCIVLTGSGERAFCAGADIGTMLPELRRLAETNQDHGTFGGLTRSYPTRKPIIAAINGVAFGGGLELALACDLRLASRNARFGLPEVTVGVLAGGGGATRLPRYIPPALAAEMLLTGEPIDSDTALSAGLVSRVFDTPAALLEGALDIAERIARNAPLAVARTLQLVRLSQSISLAEGLGLEREGFRDLVGTRDAQEGIAAFSERRAPAFAGR